MPLVLADRVVEQTTTQGTNNFELIGTSAGYQAFSVVGNGSTVYYTAEGVNDDGTLTGQWEVGQGVYNAGVLSRDTILSSSTGSKVSFSAGQKNVFIDLPSEKAVVLDDTDKVSGYNISGGTINGTSIGATTPSTGRFTSVTTPSVTATTNDLAINSVGTGSITFSSGNGIAFKMYDGSGGTAQVNYWQARGRGAGAAPFLLTAGTDTNISGNISSAGTGAIALMTNGGSQTQFQATHTASAVNYVQVTGAATGANPVISVTGSDSNVSANYVTKGAGFHAFLTNTNVVQFQVAHTGSSVNYLTATGASTNAEPRLFAQGNDTNINIAIQPKGTGSIDLASGSTGVNVSNGTTVTAITRTVTGSGYTSIPTITISAPNIAGGVQATAFANMFGFTVTIVSGGTGYTVGDALTAVGGTGAPLRLTVSTVSAGVITAVTIADNGYYSALPTNPISVTGGTGTGATFNIPTYGVSGVSVSNSGSGYTSQPTVTFSGGGGSGASAYATVGSSVRLQSLGTTSELAFAFRGASGINSPTAPDILRLLDVGNANDTGIFIQNSPFGRAQVQAYGNANANLLLCANGSGRVSFTTNGTSLVEQMRVSHTASAVNYVQVTGSGTSGQPRISAQGSDASIALRIASKGTFNIQLENGSSQAGFMVSPVGAANYLQATSANANNAPVLSAQGSDTNIDLSLASKGTGGIVGSINSGTFAFTRDTGNNAIKLTATNTANLYLQSTGGGAVLVNTSDTVTTQLRVTHTASAVNYVQVTGASTTNRPRVSFEGSDTNIGGLYIAKGSGGHSFCSDSNASVVQFSISRTASAVNNLQATGSATGLSPTLSAIGTDTNIDLTLTPKGTGRVKFGTHTATADTAISGYIEILDAGGTVRRLAVIS